MRLQKAYIKTQARSSDTLTLQSIGHFAPSKMRGYAASKMTPSQMLRLHSQFAHFVSDLPRGLEVHLIFHVSSRPFTPETFSE